MDGRWSTGKTMIFSPSIVIAALRRCWAFLSHSTSLSISSESTRGDESSSIHTCLNCLSHDLYSPERRITLAYDFLFLMLATIAFISATSVGLSFDTLESLFEFTFTLLLKGEVLNTLDKRPSEETDSKASLCNGPMIRSISCNFEVARHFSKVLFSPVTSRTTTSAFNP